MKGLSTIRVVSFISLCFIFFAFTSIYCPRNFYFRRKKEKSNSPATDKTIIEFKIIGYFNLVLFSSIRHKYTKYDSFAFTLKTNQYNFNLFFVCCSSVSIIKKKQKLFVSKERQRKKDNSCNETADSHGILCGIDVRSIKITNIIWLLFSSFSKHTNLQDKVMQNGLMWVKQYKWRYKLNNFKKYSDKLSERFLRYSFTNQKKNVVFCFFLASWKKN